MSDQPTIFNQPWFTLDDGENTNHTLLMYGSPNPEQGFPIMDTIEAFQTYNLNPYEAMKLAKYVAALHNANLEHGLVPLPELPQAGDEVRKPVEPDDSGLDDFVDMDIEGR